MSEEHEAKNDPWDIEIEQALIGAMFVDNKQIDVAAAEIEARHFYDPLHQRIFAAICALSLEGAVTPVILASLMKRDTGFLEVGGFKYLAGCAQAAPSSPNTKDFCRVLKEFALRRELIEVGEVMISNALSPMRAQDNADEATERLLMLGRIGAGKQLTPYDLALQSLRDIEAMHSGAQVPGVRTGLRKLDDEFGMLRGADLIVVAGKSGMGKSALMGCLARNTAFANVPTLVFSIEMTKQQWVERTVCDIDFDTATTPMWYSKVRNGRINGVEFDRFGAAAGKLHSLPFEIRDEDDLTIAQITAIARAFKAKHGGKTGIVFVDYLQIVNPGDARDRNREQQVAHTARGLKQLAKMLNWPVVAGSQLNEGAEGRAKEEKRPQASDVRESKGIMNEADLMLSPWREAYYIENTKPLGAQSNGVEWANWKLRHDACKNRIDILTLKNRHGHKPDVELFCEMGSSAIRDQSAIMAIVNKQQDENAAGLLV